MSNEINDIFTDTPQQAAQAAQPENPTTDFDKEAWAAKKKEERERVYAMSDDIAAEVASDPARFRQYLDTQSRFDRYTATNALLVMAQRPDATRLGNLDYWRNAQIYIKKSELQNPVLILEPGNKYERDNGQIGTSFNVRKVYDVSQAQREVKPRNVISRWSRNPPLIWQASICSAAKRRSSYRSFFCLNTQSYGRSCWVDIQLGAMKSLSAARSMYPRIFSPGRLRMIIR